MKRHYHLLLALCTSYKLLMVPIAHGAAGDIIKTIVTKEAQLNALAFDGQGDLWFNRPVSLQSYLFEVDSWGNTKTDFMSTYTEYTGMVWIAPFLYALSTSSPNRIHLLNLEQQKIVGDIRIPEEHCSLLAFDGNFFWTFSGKQKKLIQVDWTGKQIRTLDPVDENLTGLAFKDGTLWQLNAGVDKTTIFKTDPDTGGVMSSFEVNKRLENLTFYGSDLWVVEYFQGNAHQVEAEVFSSPDISHQLNLKGNILIHLSVGKEVQWFIIPFREEFLLKSDGSCTGIALEGQWEKELFTLGIELNTQDFSNDFLFPFFLSLGYSDLNLDELTFEAESLLVRCVSFSQLVAWGLTYIQGQGSLGPIYQDQEFSLNALGILSGNILSLD